MYKLKSSRFTFSCLWFYSPVCFFPSRHFPFLFLFLSTSFHVHFIMSFLRLLKTLSLSRCTPSISFQPNSNLFSPSLIHFHFVRAWKEGRLGVEWGRGWISVWWEGIGWWQIVDVRLCVVSCYILVNTAPSSPWCLNQVYVDETINTSWGPGSFSLHVAA